MVFLHRSLKFASHDVTVSIYALVLLPWFMQMVRKKCLKFLKRIFFLFLTDVLICLQDTKFFFQKNSKKDLKKFYEENNRRVYPLENENPKKNLPSTED